MNSNPGTSNLSLPWVQILIQIARKASANENAIGRFACWMTPDLIYLGWTFITESKLHGMVKDYLGA